MHRKIAAFLCGSALAIPFLSRGAEPEPPGAERQWIEDSNRYTQMLVDVRVR